MGPSDINLGGPGGGGGGMCARQAASEEGPPGLARSEDMRGRWASPRPAWGLHYVAPSPIEQIRGSPDPRIQPLDPREPSRAL